MFNVFPGEILVICLVLLIVVGPDQLPGVIRKTGFYFRKFRNYSDQLKDEFISAVDENSYSSKDIVDPPQNTDPDMFDQLDEANDSEFEVEKSNLDIKTQKNSDDLND